ncbi:hypothetical protein CYMTET_44378 [Cymbomonas tetramitiformis]|uniref:Uncharacterized protein n=1 Tax=Cymbomonas tetramitiformis TaxID=36881 RepID=A0AAE0C252_9CHLO|nr:hypothetical protein CYMTET_44378 [Cymbomonas tetramitiformis]
MTEGKSAINSITDEPQPAQQSSEAIRLTRVVKTLGGDRAGAASRLSGKGLTRRTLATLSSTKEPSSEVCKLG